MMYLQPSSIGDSLRQIQEWTYELRRVAWLLHPTFGIVPTSFERKTALMLPDSNVHKKH